MDTLHPNLTRKTAVLALTEGTYGTKPTIASATDALLIFGDGAGVYTPNISLIDYQALTGTVTRQPMKSGAKSAGVNINTCLMVSSKAGTAAPSLTTFYDDLLGACGLISNDATGVRHWRPHTTTTSNMESVAFEIYTDGIQHDVTGAMGYFTLNCTAGDIPRLNFSFTGKYNSPAVGAMPTDLAYPVDRKALVGASNSLAITRNSNTVPSTGENTTNTDTDERHPVVRSFTLSSGNAVAPKSDINEPDGFAGFHIPDRRPTISVVYEVEKDFTHFSPINDLEDAVTHNIQFTHTTPVASSLASVCKTEIVASQAQLTSVNYSDDGGIRMYNCAYALTHNDGDSDVTNREYRISNYFTA